MVGFFLYFFTLGQPPGRMEAGDIHPAVFNSSPSGFAHPHPLVPSSIQGCPRLGRVWAKSGPANTICQFFFCSYLRTVQGLLIEAQRVFHP